MGDKWETSGRQVGDKWETSGKQENVVERDFHLETARKHKDHKGSKKQKQTRNTNEIMMKLEQDTGH